MDSRAGKSGEKALESGEASLWEDGNSAHSMEDDFGSASSEVATGECVAHFVDKDGEKASRHEDEHGNDVCPIVKISAHGAH